MTNKTLVFIIIVILIVGAGLAGIYYWQQTKPLKIESMDQNANQQTSQTPPSQDNQTPASTQTNNASTTPPAPAPAPTAQTTTGCVRNFDANKLAGNANLSITNRQVAIDVKGFGAISLEFYDKDAPKTVENFLRLADSGYYNCLTFHRVAKGFVIQGGDPKGDGSGGQSAYGAPFADELNPNTPSYKAGYVKGVLAMANSGPNTNGSQFFIMLADNDLPHSYTIFGKVTSGLDVVDKIGEVPITPQMGPTDGTPVTPVVMQSVKITK